MERKFDVDLDCVYEIWSEFEDTRIYDIDISLIIDNALDYMSLCSLWCFDVWSSNGTTEVDILEALNREGYIVLIDARANRRVILTKNRLILGLQRRESMGDIHLRSVVHTMHNKHKKSKIVYRFCSAAYSPKLCDELIQLAVYGRILYE